MSRKDQRVRYTLDASGIKTLGGGEIAAILRGADDMIARGGRTQLAKLLKGSREKTLLEHGLDRNPSYGFYRDLAIEEVLRRIDWAILNGYLRVEYAGRLPVLVFTAVGWDIEKQTMAEELFRGFDECASAGPPYDFSHLKDRDREMIHLLLDRIETSGRAGFIPLLQAWAAIDYAKVRARIANVIRRLSGAPPRRQDD